MTEQINLALREYVTSVGFSLTLSKRMIQVLVALDHFKGDFHAMIAWQNDPAVDMMERVYRRRYFNHYVTSLHALTGRGLVRVDMKYNGPYVDTERSRHRVTRAGRHVIGLLKDAGIYQDWIKEMGIE